MHPRLREAAPLLALAALAIAPIWSTPVFPSQDGPVHLANAAGLAHYESATGAVLRDYFTLSSEPNPNWTIQLVLAALVRVFPPATAEKLAVSLIVAGLPLALAFALRGIRKGSEVLAPLALPFAYGFCLHLGLYNFCASLVLFVLLLGAWLRVPEGWGLGRTLLFALGGLALYFTHIVSTLSLIVAIGMVAGVRAASGFRGSPREAAASALRWLRGPALALLPAAALVAWFVASESGQASPLPRVDVAGVRLSRILSLHVFTAFGDADRIGIGASLAVGAALAVRALATRGGAARSDLRVPLASAALLFAVFALFTPNRALGGHTVVERFVLYTGALALLWLGTFPLTGRRKRAARLASAGVGVLAMATTAWQYRALEPEVQEYVSCSGALEPGHSVLGLSFGYELRGVFAPRRVEPVRPRALRFVRVDPTLHAANRLAVEREGVALNNFSAYNGNHPLIWRPERAPSPGLLCTDCREPSTANPLAYERTTAGRADYVMLWRPPQAPDGSLDWSQLGRLGAQLGSAYQLACRTLPSGSGFLFTRTGGRVNAEHSEPDRRGEGAATRPPIRRPRDTGGD